jgi:hypothetical protein
MDITSATVMIMETHVFCGSLFVEEELKMKMPDSEYNSLKQLISNWNGTKEELQMIYDRIAWTYDDGPEMLRRLDKCQSRWSMNLH